MKLHNRPRARQLATLFASIFTMLVPGCYTGISGNPFRLPALPANDIVRTHAKPSLNKYYKDFDPRAVQIQVIPCKDVNPVRTQHVLIASVCDCEGTGLRNRRVEWHVEGAGHIVEVDESGFFSGRGYMVNNKYGVSYTNYKPHKLTRGNDDPSDDIELKPGQSWCVITSAEEGETYVTVVAPEIANWDRHKCFVTKTWIDAKPCYPPPAVNPTGQPHTFVTRVTRVSDGSPAEGYRVRYRIIDGPPAVLDPGGAREVTAVTNREGNASVVIRQVSPMQGMNRVAIEVYRPSDSVTGKESMVGSGMTSKTWVCPQISIQKQAPQQGAVGVQLPYRIMVTNSGSIASQGVTVRDTLAPGLQLYSATPPATQQGSNLIWRFGVLQPQQTATIEVVCIPTAAGTVTNCAEAMMAEGPTGRSCATTEIVAPSLVIQKDGPQTGLVGQPLTFQITVQNRGQGPATNVVVTDTFDEGLIHESGSGPVQVNLGALGPGEARTVPITLTAKNPGRLCNRVSVTAEGGIQAADEHCVDVVQAQLSVNKTGPRFAFVGAPVEFNLSVRNNGSIAATNVMLQDILPPNLQGQQASDGGVVRGEQAIWNLGTLQPGEERSVRLIAVASQTGDNVCNQAVVTADGGVRVQSPQACLDIRGVPAFLTELIDRLDPVPVGGETTYTIQITNQGSVAANGVRLQCKMPEGLEFVDAEGATAHQYDPRSRTVRFEPFNGMAPRKRLLYQVQARAIKAGDFVFEATVKVDELKRSVTTQEGTTVYDPQTGAISKAKEPTRENPVMPVSDEQFEESDTDNGEAPALNPAPRLKVNGVSPQTSAGFAPPPAPSGNQSGAANALPESRSGSGEENSISEPLIIPLPE